MPLKKYICTWVLINCLLFLSSCVSLKNKSEVKQWFNKGATNCDIKKNLHKCSNWSYLSERQFRNMIFDGTAKMNPKIKDGASVFDLGVGVGAALKEIARTKKNITVGGSDLSETAIKTAKKVFPHQAGNFFIHDMTKKHESIKDNSIDHVVSFGALGMYLSVEEMRLAFKEAFRMAKPGGSFIFTSFISKTGIMSGSIMHRVNREEVKNMLTELGYINIKIHSMIHQGDRFQVSCTKPQ